MFNHFTVFRIRVAWFRIDLSILDADPFYEFKPGSASNNEMDNNKIALILDLNFSKPGFVLHLCLPRYVSESITDTCYTYFKT
jgi:hypothetical protein